MFLCLVIIVTSLTVMLDSSVKCRPEMMEFERHELKGSLINRL